MSGFGKIDFGIKRVPCFFIRMSQRVRFIDLQQGHQLWMKEQACSICFPAICTQLLKVRKVRFLTPLPLDCLVW